MPSPDRAISPPPLKRRRISDTPPQQPHPPPPPIHTPTTPSPTPQTTLRIYSWNINGIHPFLPPSTPPITTFLKPPTTPSQPPPPPPSLRATLKRWQYPQILCLQEVKIAPTDTTTQPALQRTINTPLDPTDRTNPHRPLYDAHFCLPRDKHNATGFGGKVYGVCTLIRRDVPTPVIKTVQWDLEGRVLLTELRTWGLVLINIYAVNGTANAYRDPLSGKVLGTRHDRKRVFHALLSDEIRAYECRKWDVVVVGDMNVAREPVDAFPCLRMGDEHGRSRRDFEERLVGGVGLVDMFRALHGKREKFTYRPRGKAWGEGGDRVDMGLVTGGLAGQDRVRGADVLDSVEERGPSDHCPLFVEVDVGRAEGDGGVGGDGYGVAGLGEASGDCEKSVKEAV